MAVREVFAELDSRMEKAVDALVRELATIRTGRASSALVDHIMVEYQGAVVPLQKIAGISVSDANLIIIQPWDNSSLRDINKAILKADIGLNPQSAGNVIRVIIPPLSEERRMELAKLVSKKVEERRVALRNIRRDEVGKLREMEKNKEISQDEIKNAIRQVDELSNSFMDRINEIGQKKEREIMEV